MSQLTLDEIDLGAVTVQTEHSPQQHQPHLIVLPGVLNTSATQHEPVKEVFMERFTTVSYMDYTEAPRLNTDGIVEALLWMVKSNLSQGTKTVLLGSSFGGLMITDMLKELRGSDEHSLDSLNQTLSSVVIDPPANAESLLQVPEDKVELATKLANGFTPSKLSNHLYGPIILRIMRGIPHKDEIETVEGGPSVDDIRQIAIKNYPGTSFTLWYDQVVFMLNRQAEELNHLDGLNVTYVACREGEKNYTIRQPQTREMWRPHVTHVVDVDNSPHVGYLQMQLTWTDAMEGILDQALVLTNH